MYYNYQPAYNNPIWLKNTLKSKIIVHNTMIDLQMMLFGYKFVPKLRIKVGPKCPTDCLQTELKKLHILVAYNSIHGGKACLVVHTEVNKNYFSCL
jgi:hypothetical protein